MKTSTNIAIILTKIEESIERVGTYGGQMETQPNLCIVSLTWLNKGTSSDLEKATEFATKEGYTVHTFPSGRGDHRELAENAALRLHRDTTGNTDSAHRNRNFQRIAE